MQRIKLKRKIPNIFWGLVFGFLAMYLKSSFWAYICFSLSSIAYLFGNDIINVFTLNAGTGKFKMTGDKVIMTYRDKNENIINKRK